MNRKLSKSGRFGLSKARFTDVWLVRLSIATGVQDRVRVKGSSKTTRYFLAIYEACKVYLSLGELA
jgi:hypothetical protein